MGRLLLSTDKHNCLNEVVKFPGYLPIYLLEAALVEVVAEKIKIDELRYYFDSEAKNSLDKGGAERRNGQLMMLREKMLSLPEQDFDMAMRTMEKLVEVPAEREKNDPKKSAQHLAAQKLYATVVDNALPKSAHEAVEAI